jgi:cell division protein FtsL
VVVLLFLALFLVAVSHALLIQSQVKLDRLDKQVAAEQNRYEQLRSDVSDLESPNRIQQQASKIGMVPGGDPVWVTPDQQSAKAGADDGTKAKDNSTGKGQEDSPDTSYSDVKPYLGSTP